MLRMPEKLDFSSPRRKLWMLTLVTLLYVVAELGHFIISVITQSVARDIQYGDQGCFLKEGSPSKFTEDCEDAKSEADCYEIYSNSSFNNKEPVCHWNYTGGGLEYQILAGPTFIGVFTVTGIFWGMIADVKSLNRIYLLAIATVIFTIGTVGSGFANAYWQLVMFRMLHAAGEAGCNPLSAGLISDYFPTDEKGRAMSLFQWGIYLGFGLSFAVGTYVTDANILEYGWRASFVISGLPGILLGVLLLVSVKDPRCQKTEDAEENVQDVVKGPETKQSVLQIGWETFKDPAAVFLVLGSCARQAAGFTWSYNSALYFQQYYPDHNTALWLSGTAIFGGTAGAALGGVISDYLVQRLGLASRALVLSASSLISCPLTLGILYVDPPYAFIFLLLGLLTCLVYFLAAGMWFGVMFAILMELVPYNVRSTSVVVTLFIINNIGGNIPVLVDVLENILTYRHAVAIMYSGSLLICSLLFMICWLILKTRRTYDAPTQ